MGGTYRRCRGHGGQVQADIAVLPCVWPDLASRAAVLQRLQPRWCVAGTQRWPSVSERVHLWGTTMVCASS